MKQLRPPSLPSLGFSPNLPQNFWLFCPQLSGQGRKKTIYHLNLPLATEVSLESLPRATSRVPMGEDVLESPALHTGAHQEGDKEQPRLPMT